MRKLWPGLVFVTHLGLLIFFLSIAYKEGIPSRRDPEFLLLWALLAGPLASCLIACALLFPAEEGRLKRAIALAEAEARLRALKIARAASTKASEPVNRLLVSILGVINAIALCILLSFAPRVRSNDIFSFTAALAPAVISLLAVLRIWSTDPLVVAHREIRRAELLERLRALREKSSNEKDGSPAA